MKRLRSNTKAKRHAANCHKLKESKAMLMPRFLCKIFGHRRSSRRARRVEDGWVSQCKRCGVKLVRTSKGAWNVAE